MTNIPTGRQAETGMLTDTWRVDRYRQTDTNRQTKRDTAR